MDTKCEHPNTGYDRKARMRCNDCGAHLARLLINDDGKVYGRDGLTYRRTTPKLASKERKAAKLAAKL